MTILHLAWLVAQLLFWCALLVLVVTLAAALALTPLYVAVKAARRILNA